VYQLVHGSNDPLRVSKTETHAILDFPHPLKLGKEVLEPFGGDCEGGGEAAPVGFLAGVDGLEVGGG